MSTICQLEGCKTPVGTGLRKYCSFAHAHEAHRAQLRANTRKRTDQRQKERSAYTCGVCERPMTALGHGRGRIPKYCSDECKAIALKRQLKALNERRKQERARRGQTV
jgi:hypothetical protein